MLLKSVQLKISIGDGKRTKVEICMEYSYINPLNPMGMCFRVDKEGLTSFETIWTASGKKNM